MTPAEIKATINTIPDYPKTGIQFRDVTSLMRDKHAFRKTVELLAEHYSAYSFDHVVGTEARGFIFGAPLAIELGIGFIPVRKPNKLPGKVISQSYDLEYGKDTLEMHHDSIFKGDHVLMIDDLLATGGTMLATAGLIRKLGGVVTHAGFVVSLPDIGGAERLESEGIQCHSICQFEGD